MELFLFLSLLFHNSPYKTLQWSDFQGSFLNADPNVLALTSWNIQLNTYYNEGKAAYIVTPEFVPEKSFTRTSDPIVLEHEQIHLDIVYLFALKMEKEMDPYQNTSESNEKKVEKIYLRLIRSCRTIQETYDHETQHSNCKAQQKRWNDLISKQLNQ